MKESTRRLFAGLAVIHKRDELDKRFAPCGMRYERFHAFHSHRALSSSLLRRAIKELAGR